MDVKTSPPKRDVPDINGVQLESPSFITLFEHHAAIGSDCIAIQTSDCNIAYHSLNQCANRIAHFLMARGVGPEMYVGICLPPSPHFVAAILGVLKSGAAYLPLDPDHPGDRIRRMVKETRICFFIGFEPPALSIHDGPFLTLSHYSDIMTVVESDNYDNPTHGDRTSRLLPEHPAYVIYTSGSTGHPKGVVIPHSALNNLVKTQLARLAVQRSARILQFAQFIFDASIWELAMTLTAGATLVMASSAHRAGKCLEDVINSFGITHATLPPLVLATLDPTVVSLPNLIVAGENCSQHLASRWLTDRMMFNAYGPTETTVCATMSDQLRDTHPPTIGRPCDGVMAYVLDENMEAVSCGIAGELYIAGSQLARGYINQPGLTAERFVANPFGPAGSRMYRTGDLVRSDADGTLTFLGRLDHQVKIRGQRVELGEIEATMCAYPGVLEAVAIAREKNAGNKQLIAYYVAEHDDAVSPSALRRYLEAKLPTVMIPDSFVALASFPRTTYGKLDRDALPSPLRAFNSEIYVAPRTPDEKCLCSLYADVLKLDRVGIDDDFFAQGGDSLSALQLALKVEAALGVEISIASLFEAPTPRTLALHNNVDPYQPILYLRRGSSRMTIFVLPPRALSWIYSALLPHLPQDVSVIGLQDPLLTMSRLLPPSLEVLAEHFGEQIVRIQRTGPYCLLGYSFGGILAFAVSAYLRNQGQIGLLALLDTYPRKGGPDPSFDIGDPTANMAWGWRAEVIRRDLARTVDAEYVEPILAIEKRNRLAVRLTALPHLKGDLLVFTSQENSQLRSAAEWRPYLSGNISAVQVSSSHNDMCSFDSLTQIGPIIAEKLKVISAQ